MQIIDISTLAVFAEAESRFTFTSFAVVGVVGIFGTIDSTGVAALCVAFDGILAGKFFVCRRGQNNRFIRTLNFRRVDRLLCSVNTSFSRSWLMVFRLFSPPPIAAWDSRLALRPVSHV